MTPDQINGSFEVFGALFTCLNIKAVLKDKKIQGVRIAPTVFFTFWGFWNLYYYPHLDQLFSFVGGCAIVLANLAWIFLAFRFRGTK